MPTELHGNDGRSEPAGHWEGGEGVKVGLLVAHELTEALGLPVMLGTNALEQPKMLFLFNSFCVFCLCHVRMGMPHFSVVVTIYQRDK